VASSEDGAATVRMEAELRVFLSWSGQKSRLVAEALRDWLPDVVNAVKPWMSEEDIEKGAVGAQKIAEALKDCRYGIICLTRQNQDRPWINYEAGALSKTVGDVDTRVAPLLIDFERKSEVTGPLSAFQMTMPTLEDVTRMVVGIDAVTDTPRESQRVQRVVKSLWEPLEAKIKTAQEITAASPPPKRSADDILSELLEISRETARAVARIEPWERTVEATYRTGWRGANALGLPQRVQLSTRDAMERDMMMISSSLGYPLNYLFEIDDSGIRLIVQGEYPEEAREAISTAALQRGIPVSFQRGVVATRAQASPPSETP
jgi:hypothetical protein